MAELFDITDFKGIKTNADVEDVDSQIAQAIENLRLVDGKLVKTFAGGTPTTIPALALATINTELSKNFVVYGLYTFVSDKVTTPLSDAGDGFKYVVVLIENTTQEVKLIWWDEERPNPSTEISQFFPVSNTSMYLKLDSVHKFDDAGDSSGGHYVLIQSAKSPNNTDLPNVKTYAIPDATSTTTALDLKITLGPSYCGALWYGQSSGDVPTQFVKTNIFQGLSPSAKKGTDVTTAGTGLFSTNTNLYGSASMSNGNYVVDFATYHSVGDSDSRIVARGFNSSTSWTGISATIYNGLASSDDVGTPIMIGFNGAIYVSLTGGSTKYLLKYTYSGSGTNLVETTISSSSTHSVVALATHPNENHLYAVTNLGAVYKIDTSDNVLSTGNIFPTNAKKLAIMKKPTGIRIWGHDGANNLRYIDWNSSDVVPWQSETATTVSASDLPWYTQADNQTNKHIETFQNESGSNNDNLIFSYIDSNVTYYKATRHNDSYSAKWTSIVSIHPDLPTDGTVDTGDGWLLGMKRIGDTPLGISQLYFILKSFQSGNDASNIRGGSIRLALEGLGTGNGITTLYDANNLGLCKGHHICMINGVSTHSSYLTYGTGYIVNFYISYTDASNNASYENYHIKDIGWQSTLSNSWTGSGSCEYRWVDLSSKVSLPTVYHKKQRNPVIPFGDSFRVLPGNVGKISSNEAKGIWIGYISRSLFNGGIVHSADFYGYENRLTNPFKLLSATQKELEEEIHPSDKVKYSATAIYDGIQETELRVDETDILQITTASAPDSSKCENLVHISFNPYTMNKRITGMKLYRSYPSSTNVYEPYKLIKSYNFVDTGVNTSYDADAKLFFIAQTFKSNFAVVYDSTNLISNWMTSEFSNNTTWAEGNTKYALKIGSVTKRRLKNIWNMRHYPVIGTAKLSTGISATDTTIAVTSTSGLNPEGYYLLGFRGTGEINNSNDIVSINDSYNNTSWNRYSGTWANTNEEYQNYEVIQIDVGGVDAQNNTITVTRGVLNSIARPHSQHTPFKSGTLANSKWYLFKSKMGQNFGDYHNEHVKIYKEKTGFGWYDDPPAVSYSTGGFCGGKMMLVLPRMNMRDASPDFAPWRNTDGTINVSQLTGRLTFLDKRDTDLPEVFEDSTSSDAKDVKIKEAYNNPTYESDGFIPVLAQDHIYSENLVSVAEFEVYNPISLTLNADGNSEINILDNGLRSLQEHPFESEDNITINGQYGKILKGRLFLGNIVLDPGDEAEDHSDWVSYSELDQFDVRPVSNIIPFEDREGGGITGLSEMFGRLVVFKPQAIFVLDIVNPADPTSWTRKESKINVGNVATEGLIEVHDSLFIVHNDGIYRVTANMIASATATPSQLEKITEDIDDIFNAIDSKTAVKGIYDQSKNEIIYKWVRSSASEIWAYHIYRKTWRKISLSDNADIWAYSENSNPMAWDSTNKKILKFDVNSAVGTLWKSKRFRLDYDRKRLIRYATLRHTSNENITFKIYLDGSNSASFTHSVTATGTSKVSKFPVKRYLKNFEVELVTANSLNNVEIEQLTFEME